ncbi:MAG: nuclease-related domain-containing protein [bacterium]|nr:nuclease-related domain-containing protein [bacterium]
MKIVSPARPLVRRQRTLFVFTALAVSAGIFLVFVALALAAFPWAAPTSSSYDLYTFARTIAFFLGGVLIVVGAGFGIRSLTLRTENTDAVITAREMARFLDDRFTFFTNLNKPGLGYIDGVLVGPPGALVFRILDDRGVYFNEGAGWLRGGPNGRPVRPSPTDQAIEDIKALREFLVRNQLDRVPVFGVIVFTRPDPVLRLQVKDPAVPATHMQSLNVRLRENYLAKDRIDTDTADATSKLLQIR